MKFPKILENISAEFILTRSNIIYFLIVMSTLSLFKFIYLIYNSYSENKQLKKLNIEKKKKLDKSIRSCVNKNKKYNVLRKRNLDDLVELSKPIIIKKLKIDNNNLDTIIDEKEQDLNPYIDEVFNKYFN